MVDVVTPPSRLSVDLCAAGDDSRALDAGATRCATNLKYLAEGGHNLVIVDEKVSLTPDYDALNYVLKIPAVSLD